MWRFLWDAGIAAVASRRLEAHGKRTIIQESEKRGEKYRKQQTKKSPR